MSTHCLRSTWEQVLRLSSWASMTGRCRLPRSIIQSSGSTLTVRQKTSVETDPGFEYGMVPIDRPFKVEDVIVEPGALAVIPSGHDSLRLETRGGEGRVMLLGGAPLGEEVKMWWNFVARTNEEITEAWRDWQGHNTDRFASVPSGLARIDAPTPPWVRGDD